MLQMLHTATALAQLYQTANTPCDLTPAQPCYLSVFHQEKKVAVKVDILSCRAKDTFLTRTSMHWMGTKIHVAWSTSPASHQVRRATQLYMLPREEAACCAELTSDCAMACWRATIRYVCA